ncbi:hypothetical protein KY290_016323 [Solanum tuberosum]|uniref:Reverse transcriptase domain-containing protein n=1 Tax=Solanum tuberosum TaxID=4113 RepID=A0ABQ7VUZ5_SOLTU|nr:hypothetical protein KY290_016323 [Solanum tuberosum]
MLEELPRVITSNMNEEMEAMPTIDEVRRAVMGLNKNSAGGPDGMTGAFYQSSWEIIGEDIHKMVKAFVCGADLPRYITHTNLILIPKKITVNTFSDLRPISLSNFVNKIFSRIIHERIKVVLPKIISPEQAGFIQGRSIAENVLVVQEIVAGIGKRGKTPNMVIKLDMMKAYDRVEWLYLSRVLRRLGFGDRIIDMVYMLISYNWYSILLNGQPKAEVMSRSLNVIMQKKEFKRFGMPRGSLKLNHMAFADDMIIMCKADVGTMKLISDTLREYEDISGQKCQEGKQLWLKWQLGF